MKSSTPLPGPDAAQRMDDADKKNHLNSSGYWNLDTNEQTWALFRNVAGPHKTVKEHRRIDVIHQDLANEFYDLFKSLVVSELTHDSFCGGAFKEKVKLSSPFTDILTFVLASPVIHKDYKTIFKTQVARLYYEIVSCLRVNEQRTQESFDETFWQENEEKLKPITRAFYHARQHKDAAPLPDDISDAWLEEFGSVFTANYKKAVAGDPSAPFRVAKCIRSKYGLIIPGYDEEEENNSFERAGMSQVDDDFDHKNFVLTPPLNAIKVEEFPNASIQHSYQNGW